MCVSGRGTGPVSPSLKSRVKAPLNTSRGPPGEGWDFYVYAAFGITLTKLSNCMFLILFFLFLGLHL